MDRGDKGSYALLLYALRAASVSAGSLGILKLLPGYYLYCGSAHGPGGVRARTAHHKAISQRPHWHLDYLRPYTTLLEIWYTFDYVNREHLWTEQLAVLRGASFPFPGFGASDCRCRSHFVRLGYKPSFRAFRQRVRAIEPGHKPFYRERIKEEG